MTVKGVLCGAAIAVIAALGGVAITFWVIHRLEREAFKDFWGW